MTCLLAFKIKSIKLNEVYLNKICNSILIKDTP